MTLSDFIIPISISFFIGMLMGIFLSARKNKQKLSANESLLIRSTTEIELIKKQLELVVNQTKNLLQEKEIIQIQLAKKEADFDYVLEKNKIQKSEVERLNETFQLQFNQLANTILEEKSTRFTQLNKENLQHILIPLQEKIHHFEQRIENSHKESIDYHAALRQQILGLTTLHNQMSQETLNLTKALKGDAKTQGNWGELVLERVLEKSGLTKGREYDTQIKQTDENGNSFYPDVVIHLPDGKKMIIDAKVSLTAYDRLVNEEDENLKREHLKNHILSIKNHVDQLSAKNYADLYQTKSLNFVLLFIPIESAFALALQNNPELYSIAFDKNIVIVTPTTLLVTLKTIDSMWTNQKQQDNAYEIAKQAGALYDKFQGFVYDLEIIGKKINDTQSAYDGAMNKLTTGNGNIINRVEKLKQMGVKTKKSLPENLLNNEI